MKKLIKPRSMSAIKKVVPVRISLDSEPSKNVVPGMNAEVKIHKN
jgi:multidrug resistance efflux pump